LFITTISKDDIAMKAAGFSDREIREKRAVRLFLKLKNNVDY
jgi:hypothetical protein